MPAASRRRIWHRNRATDAKRGCPPIGGWQSEPRVISRRRLALAFLQLPVIGSVLGVWRRHAVGASSVLGNHEAGTVTMLVDRLIPATDLPGAVAIGIDRRLADLAAVSPQLDLTELRQILTAGVAWLDVQARAEAAADFHSLPEERQLDLMAAAFASDDPARKMMAVLRHRVMSLYYSN